MYLTNTKKRKIFELLIALCLALSILLVFELSVKTYFGLILKNALKTEFSAPAESIEVNGLENR